ncbi:MAG: glycosyltransferase [Pseudomonadota bacterium]
MFAHLFYILAIASIAISVPDVAYSEKSRQVLIGIGAIGVWRYGWGLTHLLRSIWFKRVWFPAQRRRAEAQVENVGHAHAFFLITSFRIDQPTTTRVYRGLFEAAAQAPAGATIVSSIVELGDQRLIASLARNMFGDDLPFRLKFVRIAGTGKRDALAHGFRAVRAFDPGPDDTLSVVDGDSVVPADVIAKCAPFFSANPSLGALTTDEICTVEGAEIFRQWYSLRFAQRQILMCSNGLARRVLTLTGRMSMFRAQLACTDEFIAGIEHDTIEHWRLGQIKMLTGDDKSSWYWLLSRGYEMYYVPDVQVDTIEQPPHPSFWRSATVLMTRWFGNMLRTNSRALALGPWRTGWFTWISVFDQRISMWTCLSGLTLALLGAVFVSPWTLMFYGLWVAVSRYIVALSLLTARPSIFVAYVPLLYFNQIYGSIIKVLVFFRLDRQKWTRQKTTLRQSGTPVFDAYKRRSSQLVTATTVAAYVCVLALYSGLLANDRRPAIAASNTSQPFNVQSELSR